MIDMEKRKSLVLKTRRATFSLILDESTGNITVTVPKNRIMYSTEEGHNNAEWVRLVK